MNSYIVNNLESLYESNIKAPSTVMELSTKEYSCIRGNYIHFSGLSIECNKENQSQIFYSTLTYGNNIVTTRKKIGIGGLH